MKRICMIDDEEDFLAVASGLLRLQGFEVETSSDPLAGVELALEKRFDIVVLDLMMPKLNGFEVIEKLNAAPGAAGKLIFALSSKRMSDDDRRFLQRSGVHFLTKPFEPNHLAERIADLLRHESA